jgi:hypothetical protein
MHRAGMRLSSGMVSRGGPVMTYDPDLYGPPEYEPLDPDLDEAFAQAAADLDDQEASDE